jgi:hypothetical protein
VIGGKNVEIKVNVEKIAKIKAKFFIASLYVATFEIIKIYSIPL